MVTLPLALQLHWRRQATTWMRETCSVRPLPAPWAPQDLTGYRDARYAGKSPSRPSRLAAGVGGLSMIGTAGRVRSAAAGTTRLSVSVVPEHVTTFIYLNGGSLLGRAPIEELPVRPGYYRLVFWAPSIRGRATHTVLVAPGQHARVATTLASAPSGGHVAR